MLHLLVRKYISRDPTTGVITNVNNQTLNLAYIQTSGVDMEVDYRFALSSIPGTWSVRLLGTCASFRAAHLFSLRARCR